ncbi:MAG: hypothetical protein WED87_06480 [Dehalococcoidia bacterium]
MPEIPGGGGGPGRIDWGEDSGEEPKTAPPPDLPPVDTPPLEFRPIHAALPSLSEPIPEADAGTGPDYVGAWLSEEETEALGDITGLRVLNAMAGTGEDAVALARMGANVAVANLEEGAVREFALAEGLEIEFTEVHDQALPIELRERAFDIVYVGPDSLPWIENLDEWSAGLAEALAPGGTLVVYDEHPLTYVFASESGRLVVNSSYFGQSVDEPGPGEDEKTLREEREAAGLPATSFGWTLGDLVTAFGDHGVATVRLEELASSERFFTALDALPDIAEDDIHRVPAAFLLVGVKLEQRQG